MNIREKGVVVYSDSWPCSYTYVYKPVDCGEGYGGGGYTRITARSFKDFLGLSRTFKDFKDFQGLKF